MAPPKSEEQLTKQKEVGSRIRRCRKTRKLSATQVASAAGIGTDHLYALERGDHAAYEHTLRRIATALGSSYEYLATGRSPRKSSPGK